MLTNDMHTEAFKERVYYVYNFQMYPKQYGLMNGQRDGQMGDKTIIKKMLILESRAGVGQPFCKGPGSKYCRLLLYSTKQSMGQETGHGRYAYPVFLHNPIYKR